MEGFIQAAAAVLLALILIMSLRCQGKDMGLLLSIFVCCTLGCLAAAYLQPVMAFLQRLQNIGSLDHEMLTTLLKVVGIAFLSEILSLVCADAGNGALGKGVQFLSVAVILWLSIPMLNALLELVESTLEKI